ncbi:MAG: valine--tRNA ligase [Deltaproteobacteria bacterium]|nr:valine--tRNA ligase [Deltaproteobacteria bacterium]
MALIDQIPKTFDFQTAADKYYAQWEASGVFTPDPDAPGEPYVIVIPPPNVTGSLHMGHALDNTLQDVLIRYKRMDGFNTLWVPGTDHAGIATQWVVERQLRAEGIDRRDLGREKFLERVWSWKEESGGTITMQLRKLGVSCDWSRERFTMDEGLSRAVREVFVRYVEEGLIYRAERMINWDPIGQTALSNLEVENEENHQTEIWSFAYPLSSPVQGPDGEDITEIVVATTRPETMLGDTAIAVHPDDPRYKQLIGTMVRHPILDREIPIVGDAVLVDPEFGTGAVKITPAHDFNDFEVGKRHKLPFLVMLNLDGTVNEVGGPFEGMDRFDARKAVKARLAEMGLERGSEPHTMALPRSQRSGSPVEPMISTQWFVNMEPLAKRAIKAVEDGETKFVPKQWENTYYAWMRDIRDWCISRQLWWGHQIPAWYCGDCDHMTVSREDATACEACGSTNIKQDEDVLDTWFSSALWPFSTLGWPDNTKDLQRYYPTSVLVTGFDIIFFWVARMMFSGLHFMDQAPFSDVYIHALVRDENGLKMSKTKGNVVDPLERINEIGADALRMTLVAMETQGRDILWNNQRANGYVKFQNKMWQAFRFTMMHLEEYDVDAERTLSAYDHWILARTGEAVKRVRGALDNYKFNEAAGEIYAFTWDELCDWYLEFSKGSLYSEEASEAAKQGARHTLWTVFESLVRLIHPIMPFLSEEIWQTLPNTEGSIVSAPYPKVSDFPSDPESLRQVATIQEVIKSIRRIRADMEISPRLPIGLRTKDPSAISNHPEALRDLAGVHSIEAGGRTGPASTFVVNGAPYFVPLEGVVDVDAERARLDKVIAKVDADIGFLNKKLANKGFMDRAPEHVVSEVRTKHAAAEERRARLDEARTSLDG